MATKNDNNEQSPSENGLPDINKLSMPLRKSSRPRRGRKPSSTKTSTTKTESSGTPKRGRKPQSPQPQDPILTTSTTGRQPKTTPKRPYMHVAAGQDPDAQDVHENPKETWDEPVEEKEKVVFRPNKGPQTDFFASTEREVLFGGAAGGGKSYALLVDPLRYIGNSKNSALLLRRTTEELRELRWKSQELYPQIYPQIKWSERNQNWVMPSGGRLWMSFLDADKDVLRYQGQAFNWIGFDELTQWPSAHAWNYLRSRLRTTAKELPLFMRASTNPGNAGAWWVKKMFIDPAPWNTAFWATDMETGEVLVYPEGHRFAGKPLFKRRFIPSNLADNPYLYEDGQYESNLLGLPEHLRKQLLEGSWDVIEGAAFPEWNRKIHVIEPFPIPQHWRRFRAMDYGYGSFTGVVWFAIHPSGQLIVYRDLEVSKVTAWDLADIIAGIEDENDERLAYGVLDFSIGADRGQRGPTLVEQLQRNNLRWRPADRGKGSRVAGKNMVHRLLQVDEFTEEPGLVFFKTCTHCISQIPVIPLDKNNPEDVDTDSRDHIYDALRYGVMTRPRPGLLYDPHNRDRIMPEAYVPSDEIFGY